MKRAVPVLNGQLFPHFGRSSGFAFFAFDASTGNIVSKEIIAAPPHEPGILHANVCKRDGHHGHRQCGEHHHV